MLLYDLIDDKWGRPDVVRFAVVWKFSSGGRLEGSGVRGTMLFCVH